MDMRYLGHLQRRDPLYDYLHYEIQPKVGLHGDHDYRVFRLHASNNVYLYEDTKTLKRIIGKFYYSASLPMREAAHNTMTREFSNLEYMRSMGFGGYGKHYIARPLGQNSDLNELLLEECCYGESLSSVIQRSIRDGDPGVLYYKLTALAFFLSRFHNQTAQPHPVDFEPAARYAHGMLHTLRCKNWVSGHREEKLHRILEEWKCRPEMWSDCQVIVHGDATPENFLFGDGLHVISFDLERMRCADRVFDLGRLVAELSHFFLLYSGNRQGAEPYIGHFLWEYSCHFPDRAAAFQSITKRVPFYMGINFLRIARNSYFNGEYRQQLLNAASECLKGGLR